MENLRRHLTASAAIAAAVPLFVAQGRVATWMDKGITPGVAAHTWLMLAYLFTGGLVTWWTIDRVDPRLERFGFWRRLLAGEAIIVASVLALTGLTYGVLFEPVAGRAPNPAGLYTTAYKTVLVLVLVYGCWIFMRGHRGSEQGHAGTDAQEAGIGQAELAILQSQVEPHFLFNTLALAKRQYRKEPEQAAALMQALVTYLETTGPALRSADWTLGQELDLVRLYLDIVGRRFGASLAWEFDVATPLHDLRLPALVLATLVENAVRHGLGPKAGGGRITVRSHQAEGLLHIEVVDDGVGLRRSSGTGLGLATVRARLAASFGPLAELRVAPASTGGVRASLCIPQEGQHAA